MRLWQTQRDLPYSFIYLIYLFTLFVTSRRLASQECKELATRISRVQRVGDSHLKSAKSWRGGRYVDAAEDEAKCTKKMQSGKG